MAVAYSSEYPASVKDIAIILSIKHAVYFGIVFINLSIFSVEMIYCISKISYSRYNVNSLPEKVAWVKYCGLKGDKYYDLAQKYMPNGSCGVISFGLKGGRKAAETFMKHLKLGSIETHVADSRTCCLHPASATHRQMTDEQLEAAGVGADLIRLSCGLENAEDLIADLAQAIDKV